MLASSLLHEELESPPHLQRALDVGVDLGSRGWKSLASALAANTSLRTISLAGSRLGDASMASVASGLGATTGFVQQLCLSDCALTARGASAAADIIKAQAARRASAEWATSLRSPCDPRGRTIVTSGEGCSAMFEAAPGVANAIDDAEGLRFLDLSFNAIGESGVVALVTSMQFGSQVVALDLRSNGLPFRVEADMQELLVAAPPLARGGWSADSSVAAAKARAANGSLRQLGKVASSAAAVTAAL